eukprot:2481876-Rhodomonas_salina.1
MKEREIKLRAYKIPAIENLGATQDQFDTIDLSDNEIRKLEVRPHTLSISLIFPACDNGLESKRKKEQQNRILSLAASCEGSLLIEFSSATTREDADAGQQPHFSHRRRSASPYADSGSIGGSGADIFWRGEDLKDVLPSVHTLMLANNSILNLRDLNPLSLIHI